MNDYYDATMRYKIELMQQCSDSYDIFLSLDSEVRAFADFCNKGSFAVDDEPYCGPWFIECHIGLLSDLNSYTECVKRDKEIPQDLLYLVNYVDF